MECGRFYSRRPRASEHPRYVSNKDQLIRRIRQALGDPTGRTATGRSRRSDLPPAKDVLPPIPAVKLVERFEAELEAVAGSSHRARSLKELREVLLALLPNPLDGQIALSRNPLLERLGIPRALGESGFTLLRWPAQGKLSRAELSEFNQKAFAAAGAGITGADYALAESGTLVLSSETEGSQMASLAPPIHVAIYTAEQVVESLEAVLTGELNSSGERSDVRGRSLVMITGPSRTSDIEQVSIKGVHGPTHLHAILADFDWGA